MKPAQVVVQPLTLPGDPGLESGRESPAISPVSAASAASAAQTERLAAIDIGSNSIHMIVVAPEP
ncbi:MAG TPA: hypothetical protein VGR07_06900, partial [Thermoanaerobaculia bacterium]|nr:hypothetical protein [Thermoanaerobaculia bacterium]